MQKRKLKDSNRRKGPQRGGGVQMRLGWGCEAGGQGAAHLRSCLRRARISSPRRAEPSSAVSTLRCSLAFSPASRRLLSSRSSRVLSRSAVADLESDRCGHCAAPRPLPGQVGVGVGDGGAQRNRKSGRTFLLSLSLARPLPCTRPYPSPLGIKPYPTQASGELETEWGWGGDLRVGTARA